MSWPAAGILAMIEAEDRDGEREVRALENGAAVHCEIRGGG